MHVYTMNKPDVAEGINACYTEEHQTLRLIFQGAEATSKPLIASMAIDCNIAATILSATTRTLDGKIYGNMLLGIPGGPDNLATAVKYLSSEPGVTVQVDVEYSARTDRKVNLDKGGNTEDGQETPSGSIGK